MSVFALHDGAFHHTYSTHARGVEALIQVSIANSRGPESVAALAAEIGATPVSVVDAANTGEIVISSIPTKAVANLPRGLSEKLCGDR